MYSFLQLWQLDRGTGVRTRYLDPAVVPDVLRLLGVDQHPGEHGTHVLGGFSYKMVNISVLSSPSAAGRTSC